ncbi:excalibur calcium-binding domain-containing protein [Glycomyces harbinensis]|uniref:Excalibur calcium-binding domain-containing protein n=1 Tax=Glycomyces harbinensis TaxID=58114 RepID=A0A1G6Y7Z6_9ACTN|nr:excalibur calcium-binding domain-containing protein [Glycomyces harbinensis]SDD86470.1 Excalibur calcium-binding domain-containing protein [Glycomyces harbinensis]
MSTDPSAAGPQRPRVKSWSQMSTAERVLVILVFAVPVLCCGGVINMIDGDEPERETIVEEPTESESAERAFDPATDGPTYYGPAEETTSASPEPAPETEEEAPEVEEVYYENCDAARDAGAAPVEEGDPGYRSGLDSDGDGTGCEDTGSGGGGGDSGGGDSGGDSGDDDDDGGSVYYENCDAARDAGAAPVHRGDPGYGGHLDRDGDGTGCE